jgi:peptide/nickel transport system permease protein
MLPYITRRLLGGIPVLALVVVFVFLLLRLSPGDPAHIIAGDQATTEDIERIRVQLGLDQPILSQFLIWLGQILRGDLGRSIISDMPVTEMIAQRIEPTLSLALTTIVFACCTAIPLGILAAARAGTIIDRLAMLLSVMSFSFPVFFTGYLFVVVFAGTFKWLPVQGFKPIGEGLGPFLYHITLPTITLGLAYMALLTRMTRAAMLEVLQQDYIRTARAKGLGTGSVLFVHALKNAAVPIVTTAGIGVAVLIGGAVVTETVFAIPGIGRLTVDAILAHDYPVIQAVILMFSVIYVLLNLAIDISYCLLDPRVRY